MQRKKRMFATAMMLLIPNAGKRVEYMKRHQLYGHIGENVHIQSRILPLHSELIYINNNVKIASNVTFITHDIIHKMINEIYPEKAIIEKIGCIEIKDNVFIGAGTQIMYDTRIGSNVIIGAGSIVNRDVPDNSVYAGVPARYICSFEEYVNKVEKKSSEFKEKFGVKRINGVTAELAEKVYADFIKRRDTK